jgi:hypothetical protein
VAQKKKRARKYIQVTKARGTNNFDRKEVNMWHRNTNVIAAVKLSLQKKNYESMRKPVRASNSLAPKP